MTKEIIDKIRGMARRVTVKDIKDDGETQTASIEVADGVWRTDVEVLQQYGISSSAPEDGALGIALALGGDEGDIVLLPIANPSSRMGGLGKGDVGFYTKGGDRVVGRASGGIEIVAASSISLKVGDVSFMVTPDGVAIVGGTFTHDGKNIGKDHGHVSAPPGVSGPPV
ncbi:hypothetical protein D4A92_09410 [Rhizobium rosettiformans]|uniref:Bacteriophage Mu Gp45 N-terminal domain-containing protein n=1 Tax=Rhizobium rosettiformans TaxID=1368430 RepID=A0ABX7EUM1_9HYPH|nr:phage baseplate assembly protein [Rhizobium rosettiformans]QRF51635.1 hypothetical protein D4A92_09410 [Rhizobium rosettiformans]